MFSLILNLNEALTRFSSAILILNLPPPYQSDSQLIAFAIFCESSKDRP